MPWTASFNYSLKGRSVFRKVLLDPSVPVFLQKYDPEYLHGIGQRYDKRMITGEPEIAWMAETSTAEPVRVDGLVSLPPI